MWSDRPQLFKKDHMEDSKHDFLLTRRGTDFPAARDIQTVSSIQLAGGHSSPSPVIGESKSVPPMKGLGGAT